MSKGGRPGPFGNVMPARMPKDHENRRDCETPLALLFLTRAIMLVPIAAFWRDQGDRLKWKGARFRWRGPHN